MNGLIMWVEPQLGRTTLPTFLRFPPLHPPAQVDLTYPISLLPLQVQATILSIEQPDLVVFSGDMVSGYACPQPCPPGWYAERWRQLTAPVKSAGVPYAVILGNHDDEADLDRRAIVQLDIDTSGGLSLTRQGPPNTTGVRPTGWHACPRCCAPQSGCCRARTAAPCHSSVGGAAVLGAGPLWGTLWAIPSLSSAGAVAPHLASQRHAPRQPCCPCAASQLLLAGWTSGAPSPPSAHTPA